MKTRIIVLFLLPFMALPAASAAGGWRQKMSDGYVRFDRAIRRFLMSGMDSTYIRLPATSWEIPAVWKPYGYFTSISPGGKALNMDMKPVSELGAGIGYHGLDAVFTTAVSNAIDFNFEFDYYDNYWGLSINIGRETFGPELYGEPLDRKIPELHCRAIMLEGYYAVRGSRFSFPAAIYGNYLQVKSAGSPLVTFWYEHRDYDPIGERTKDIFAMRARNTLDEGALLAGYGYNFSIWKGKAVINVSACAGVPLPYLGVAANGRFACIYWINDHLRLNFNIMNFYQKSWSDKNMKMEDNTWRGCVGLAYCFGVLH